MTLTARLAFCFWIILLTACAQGQIALNALPYENEFYADCAKFKQECQHKTHVYIDEDPIKDTVARCWYGGIFDRRKVVVDQDQWAKLNSNEQKAVIYHEMGHCELSLDHNDVAIDAAEPPIPLSLMHSNFLSQFKDPRTLPVYIELLFTVRNQPQFN